MTFIIFGATGDLTRRKLLPALHKLLGTKKIEKFLIVGAARDEATPADILDRARQYVGIVDESVWCVMQECMSYARLDFACESDFIELNRVVTLLEKHHGMSGNRLIYLATAAEHFCNITTYLASSNLVTRRDDKMLPWERIVYEKPFGYDLQSAHEINACIKQRFDESQIYRIDHFLTKELVGNIALVRFTNCVFEPLWNNQFIDQVHISIAEQMTIENRGVYYDKYGALADVVQNHALELLALIAMESPEKLTGNYIRSRRADVLKQVRVVDGILGQYDGYTREKNVPFDSKTETFAALCLSIDNSRWAGVPFYIKTGKCLQKKETVIHIKFKQIECLLTRSCPVPSNWLTIEVSPEATFSLSLNAKKPGSNEEVVPVAMEFCHSCLFGEVTPQAYEVVIEEVMRGEQSVSVRLDEIEYAWNVVDAARAQRFPLYPYACQTVGPDALKDFEDKHGMRWRS